MRIAIDLDGTICTLCKPGQTYADVVPLDGVIEKIRALRESGNTIIIYTARRMGTHEGNTGKALREIGKLTFDWLEENGIEYDEIYFGKPSADIYIDDKAFKFESWKDIDEDRLPTFVKN